MMHGFSEIAVGGVLVAPFVGYAAAALALLLLIRPLLRRVGFDQAFGYAPIANVSVFVILLAVLIVLF